MDTLSFLNKILPSQGLYVLAVFRYGMDKPPAHYNCNTTDDLARLAHKADTHGVQVFHACASFATALQVPTKADPSKMRNATRSADNAAFIRSQWLDVDVGPGKDYPDRRTAVAAIVSFCKSLQLPAPMLVLSGRGLHCYWPFTRDVPAQQAKIINTAFKNAACAYGFAHDKSRTNDLASILRPIGTHWRKEGEVEVTLLRDAEAISPTQFIKALAKHINRIEVAPPPPSEFGDEWGSGQQREFPPSSAANIIKFCPTLAAVADAQGDVEEPLWRAMLGLVKHTVEGEPLAHDWSQGHPAYDADQTQTKLDNWTTGPTTCKQFSLLSDKCVGCQYASQVKSPIQLGYTEEATSAQAPEPTEPKVVFETVADIEQFAERMPDDIPFWPKNVRWSGVHMERSFRDEDGVVTWVPFCDRLFYPFLRFRQEDNTWAIKISALVNPQRGKWRSFDVPTKCIAENQTLANALGAYEIFAVGKGGKELMKQHAQDVLTGLMFHNIETVTYNAFGWHDDGFVLGTDKLTAKGTTPVYLGSRVPTTANTDFGSAGSSAEWAEAINTVYNRPGAEPYQFMIAAAFGAPLVKLVASDMWHGIPLALTGEGGLGKTTTCKVACSIFGNPEHFAISALPEGSTMNALIQRVALHRNIPIVLDEMTGRTAQEFQGLLYALSNGRPKERLRSDGTIIGEDLTWDTISFITGNINITSMLAQLDRHKAEATQLRCFEIALPANFNTEVFKGINAKDIIEDQILGRQYGVVGREYLHFVMQNREKISRKLQRMRAKYNPVNQDETRERFYMDLMVTALMGAAIATQLGFLKFDLQGLHTWATKHIRIMRTQRSSVTFSAEDYLQEFLGAMHGRTVVTKWLRDGRVHKDKAHEYVDESRLRNPVARHATEDRKFFVTTRGFSEWCKENNVNPAWLRDELDKRGHFVHRLGQDVARDRIGRGTNCTSALATIFEFNYDLIDGYSTMPRTLSVVPSEQPVKVAS